jgi:hypothetical protein
VVYITDNLCTKNGYSSFLSLESAVYTQEQLLIKTGLQCSGTRTLGVSEYDLVRKQTSAKTPFLIGQNHEIPQSG